MFSFSTKDSAGIAREKRRQRRREMAEMHAATTGVQPWEPAHYLSEIKKAKDEGKPMSYIQALESKLQRVRDQLAKAEKKAGV
jgi:hypothetical protein